MYRLGYVMRYCGPRSSAQSRCFSGDFCTLVRPLCQATLTHSLASDEASASLSAEYRYIYARYTRTYVGKSTQPDLCNAKLFNSGVIMSQAQSVYDHTYLEWEGIRDVFTKLYVEEDRHLPDIRHILGRQGFHATCVHLQVAASRILTSTSE
jgi:Clr5 domain